MKRYIGILIACLVCVIQISLVTHVGVSWDEPASFFVGQANREFWRTGDRQYIINMWNPALFAKAPIQYIYGEDIYPPFPFTFASIFSWWLAEKHKIIPVFDAYHVGEIVLASVGVAAMYGLSLSVGLGRAVSAIVTIVYALYPTIWGSMRNDAKDIPLMSMLVVSSYFFLQFLHAWQRKAWRRASWFGIGFSVSYGLSGATKPTAVLLALILGIWILLGMVRSRVFRQGLGAWKRFTLHIGLFALLSLSTFLLSWPWLWDRPISKLLYVFNFFKTVGYNMPTPYFGTIYNAAVTLPKTYALAILSVQTPVWLSVFAIIGFFVCLLKFFRKSQVYALLPVVWFAIGMGRFFLPGMIIYSWVRHFIDAMPAFFLLMGFGVEFVVERLASYLHRNHALHHTIYTIRRFSFACIGGSMIVHLALISFQFFPYEMSYFNMLVGGTKTVAQKWYFDVGQGAGIKEAMEFIAKDSGGARVKVYPCLLGHLAQFYTTEHVTLTSAPELAQYTVAPNSPSWFEGALTFGKHMHNTVYTVQRAGADLFYVYKYKSQLGWRCGWETKSNYVW